MDAPEKDLVTGDTGAVGADRRVDRLQDAIDPLVPHRPGQRVVMHATAAVHSRGSGGEVDRFHRLPRPAELAGENARCDNVGPLLYFAFAADLDSAIVGRREAVTTLPF